MRELSVKLVWSLTKFSFKLRKSPYSVRMRENKDRKNSEYRHFSRSVEYRKRPMTSNLLCFLSNFPNNGLLIFDIIKFSFSIRLPNISMTFEKSKSSRSEEFNNKHLCQSPWKSATSLKKQLDRVAFLLILPYFWEHVFRRTSANGCFFTK